MYFGEATTTTAEEAWYKAMAEWQASGQQGPEPLAPPSLIRASFVVMLDNVRATLNAATIRGMTADIQMLTGDVARLERERAIRDAAGLARGWAPGSSVDLVAGKVVPAPTAAAVAAVPAFTPPPDTPLVQPSLLTAMPAWAWMVVLGGAGLVALTVFARGGR